MFKTLIKTVIQLLKTITEELERAYYETYEISDLTKEFQKKVEQIKEQNKASFIKAAKLFEIHKGLFSGEFPSSKEIDKKANDRWEEALRSGDLDELYNLQERSSND